MSENYVASELMHVFSDRAKFHQVDRLEGEIYRQVERRRTLKVSLGGEYYFAKIHHGVGWREIIKNLLSGRLPILGARNEWNALNKLADVGVPSMEPVLYCEEGTNPAEVRSAILTRALENCISLEDFETDDLVTRRRLITVIADTARRMHAAGINHRDFYLCHFLLRQPISDPPELHLIDLHRAQIRPRVPDRWLAKDLGGLLFSALEKNISRKDIYRFVRAYSGNLGVLRDNPLFWHRVVRRAEQLYLQDHTKLGARIEKLLGKI